jgi:Na+-translocating ferredoxin:NAD+ oxidoreductase RnfD subunit
MSQTFVTPVAAPHTTTSNTPGRIMSLVMLALAPATLYGFWLYGWPAVYLWLITIAAAMLGESFCLRLMNRNAIPVLQDGSAILTGWLLAVSLPPWLRGGLVCLVACSPPRWASRPLVAWGRICSIRPWWRGLPCLFPSRSR